MSPHRARDRSGEAIETPQAAQPEARARSAQPMRPIPLITTLIRKPTLSLYSNPEEMLSIWPSLDQPTEDFLQSLSERNPL